MRAESGRLRLLADARLQHATLAWSVCDARGRLLDSGASGTAWPAGFRHCELLLPTACLRFASPVLPAGSDGLQGLALGYALEETLANAPEDNRYARCVDAADSAVLLLCRAPLDALLAQLRAQGLDVRRIVPDAMLLPCPPADGWTVLADAQGWLVRLDRLRALYLPAAAAPLAALPMSGLVLPGQILLCGATALPEAWRALPAAHTVAPDWRCAELDAAVDLLTGHERGRQGHWHTALGRAARLGLLLLLCEIGLTLVESGGLLWSRWSLERDMHSTVQRLGLEGEPVARRLGAARRALDRLRGRHGLPERNGALMLMQALAQTGLHIAPQALEYSDDGLLLTLAPEAAESLLRARSTLAAQRLQLRESGAGRLLLAFAEEGT